MAAHQAPPSLGFSRQEHWSGLPFPSPLHESEKSKRSCSVVSDPQQPHGLQPTRLLRPWDFPSKNTGVGSLSLLQGIFPTQGSNPGLLHCRQILYQLSYSVQFSSVTQSCLTLCGPLNCSPPGSSIHGNFQARILKWVAIPFSRESS